MTLCDVYPQESRSDEFYQNADRAMLSEDYDRAVYLYVKGSFSASKINERLVWDDLGYALLKKGEFGEAKKYLKNSLSVHPENYNLRLFLASIYLLDNKVDSASEQLEEIENDIYLDDSWLNKNKTHVYRKSDDLFNILMT